MNFAACIWPNQQNLFSCLDRGTCDCDWWVPLSMWDNGDKRSNLICPVGSWILLAVYPIFFWCVVHCTAHVWWCIWFFATAPISQLDGALLLAHQKCVMWFAITAILDQMTCTNDVSECLVCSSMHTCSRLFQLIPSYRILFNHPKSVQRLPAERPAKYMPVFIM